jgi:hypothetical protein
LASRGKIAARDCLSCVDGLVSVDHEPSWRWDAKRKIAFCSCIGTRPGENKGHSIFGIIGTKEGLNREDAKIRAAEIIGRPDLIVKVTRQKYQRTDAAALLNPLPENQDDARGTRSGSMPRR